MPAIEPLPSTGNTVASKPSRVSAAIGSSTARCSVAIVITWRLPRARAARATPRMARLSASVAPLVNTTSFGEQPTLAATAARPRSVASRAATPKRCPREDAFPARSVNHGSMVCTTSGSHGVVAWWSR